MNTPKIAYLILAHTDPLHLERLVNAIDYRSSIFIHLDKKSEINNFKKIKLPKSAKFINERVPVYWGGISIVKATLNLIKSALNSGEKLSHLVLLSGLDYPIKPTPIFYKFLTQNSQKQFIRLIDLANSRNPGIKRVTKYWFMEPFFFSCENKLIRASIQKLLYVTLSKKIPKNLRLAFGSQWWAITPECASFILRFVNENPSIWEFYQYSHVPDEHFFHTIVANSTFLQEAGGIQKGIKWSHEVSNIMLNFEGRNLILDDYEFLEDLSLNRKPTKQRMSQGLRDKLGELLTDSSFNYSSFFFARKFTTEQSSLIDLIDKNLLCKN